MSHPSPLTPALERAHSLVAAGDLAGAAVHLERAIEIGQATLSQDDPDVLATQRELASVRRQAGDAAAARRVLETAYEAGQFSLGDDDPLMLQISYDLGVVADELKDRDAARQAFGRVADFGPMMLGPGHWAVSRAQAYLGQDPTSPVRIEPAHQIPDLPPDNHPTVLWPAISPQSGQLPPPPEISRRAARPPTEPQLGTVVPPVPQQSAPAPQQSAPTPHGNPWATGREQEQPRQETLTRQPIPAPRAPEPDVQAPVTPAPPSPFGLLPPPSALSFPPQAVTKPPAEKTAEKPPVVERPSPVEGKPADKAPTGNTGGGPTLPPPPWRQGPPPPVQPKEQKEETQDTFRPESPWGPAPWTAKEPAETPFQQVKPGVFETPKAEPPPALYHRGSNDSVVVHRPDPVVMPLRTDQPPAPEARPDSITAGGPAAAQIDFPVRREPAPETRSESVTPAVATPIGNPWTHEPAVQEPDPVDEATTTLPAIESRKPAAAPEPADAFESWPDFNRWPDGAQPTPVPVEEPPYQPDPTYPGVYSQESIPTTLFPAQREPAQQGPEWRGPAQQGPEQAGYEQAGYEQAAHLGVYQHQQATQHPGVYHQATDGTWQGGPTPTPLHDITPAPRTTYEKSGNRKRGMALFAVIAATLAAVVAVAAMVFTLADRTQKGDEGDNQPNSPSLSGNPPTGVKLDDQGSKIGVSWADPTSGTVSFMVIMAHPGEQLKPVSTVGPGQTSRRIEGLSSSLDYCFAVVAVYGTNKFASSPQVCTDRGKK